MPRAAAAFLSGISQIIASVVSIWVPPAQVDNAQIWLSSFASFSFSYRTEMVTPAWLDVFPTCYGRRHGAAGLDAAGYLGIDLQDASRQVLGSRSRPPARHLS